jgi:hypothetical protein
MDKELSDAIEQSIGVNPAPRRINGRGTESRRAVDQLAQAVAGLLKVEEELNALTAEISGHPDEDRKTAEIHAAPAEGLPMFDRVRQDATALAELAIRMHAKLTYARERL